MNSNNIYHVDFEDVIPFSSFDKAYQCQNPVLEPYLKGWPDLDNIIAHARQRSIPLENRKILVRALTAQAEAIDLENTMMPMIKTLADPKAVTVITAHQPVLFGGPLYIIYKAISAIRLAQSIRENAQDIPVVPVFIVGAEDHDVEEMNHTYLFRKKVEWNTDQTGATGRFELEGLSEVIDQVEEILGEQGNDVVGMLRDSFSGERSYGQAYQHFLQCLFKNEGLLVVQMDDPDLKKMLLPLAQKELIEQVSQGLVQSTQDKLQKLGFSPQAHARPVNFFLLNDGQRELVEPTKDGFRIGDQEYSKDEMLTLLEMRIGDWSPNVVMRPIYQELVFPNVAYVGGGGELAYWKERRSQFDAFGMQLPYLVRRDSVAWLESHVQKRMKKAGLEMSDLFKDLHAVLKEKISDDIEIDSVVKETSLKVGEEWKAMYEQLQDFDPSLATYAQAEGRKLEKTFDNLEQKVIRSAKKANTQRVQNIEKVFDALFPNGGLQERKDNFIPLYMKYGHTFIQRLMEVQNPLDRRMKVVLEGE